MMLVVLVVSESVDKGREQNMLLFKRGSGTDSNLNRSTMLSWEV